MTLQAPSGDSILAALITAAGGGGLVKLGEALFGRKSREVRALGDTINILSDQIEAADTRMDAFGKRLDECQASHEACERGRQEDRREIEALKRRISQGQIPAYHLNAMPGDPGRGEGQ